MIIEENISIAQKPGVIWEYWMDVSNDVHWRDGIIKAEWTTQPPYVSGSAGEHTHKNMGIMKWKVTAFDEGRSFEFVHTEGGLKGSVAFFGVEAENTGSLVKIHLQVSGPFLMRIMMFFMAGIMRKGVQGDLQKLKELMEQ